MPKVDCPVCGVAALKPSFPAHRSQIAWGDCACCDSTLCLYHRYGDAELPTRPSNEVLDARAEEQLKVALTEYEAKAVKFAQVSEMQAEVERLRLDAATAFQRGVAATKAALSECFERYGLDTHLIRDLVDLKDEK
jgi:hypothetical protein